MKERVEVVNVTPDLAREWLARNTHNRQIRERVVNAYAADMLAGAWRFNGEAVKFDTNSDLLDGQHRLLAIAKSGVTVRMVVIRGLPPETQETMDGGAKRKFSDALVLRGERNATTLAASIRAVTLWEQGIRRSGSNYAPTNHQLFATLDKYPWMRDAMGTISRVSHTVRLPGSVAGLCWWLFSQIDEEDADFFFTRLADGQNLVKGDAIYELRLAIERSRSVRGERSIGYMTALTIKAWNAYRDGRPVGQLRFRPGGANPEQFPEPH